MSNFKNLYFLFSLIIVLNSCKKEPFTDSDLTKNAWVLYAKQHESGAINSKPDSLKQDIYLYFSNDFKVIGHLVSRDILEGKYSISEEGSFKFEKLIFMDFPTCGFWEQSFIDNYESIFSYETKVDESLYLNYKDYKMIFLKK